MEVYRYTHKVIYNNRPFKLVGFSVLHELRADPCDKEDVNGCDDKCRGVGLHQEPVGHPLV